LRPLGGTAAPRSRPAGHPGGPQRSPARKPRAGVPPGGWATAAGGNNVVERALRQSVIQRKISHGVQSRQGAICRSRLLIVTTTLRQQGRDVWQLLEQAWIAHHRGGVMPSMLPDP